MNDFKKNNRFGGGRRDFGRPNFGGDRGFKGGSKGFGRQMEMFQATCASCGKTCEVPFRPNGKKPVYCKECFSENGGPAASSDRGDRFAARRDFPQAPAPARASESDKSLGELKRQIETLGYKLDKILAALGADAKAEKPANAPFPVAANMPPEKEPKAKKASTKKKK